jgi:hypothetical protein
MRFENFITVKISIVVSGLERHVSIWLPALRKYMLLPSSELRIETAGSFETVGSLYRVITQTTRS